MVLSSLLSPKLANIFNNTKEVVELAHPVDLLLNRPYDNTNSHELNKTITWYPINPTLPTQIHCDSLKDKLSLDCSNQNNNNNKRVTFQDKYELVNLYFKLGSSNSSQLVERRSDHQLLLAKPRPAMDHVSGGIHVAIDIYLGSLLDHPNILSILDVVHDPQSNRLVTITEFCPWDLLSLTRNHSLDADQILSIFSQLVSGLSYLQQLGFAHRDLKLENIYITKDKTVKLTGFGCITNPQIDHTDSPHLVGSLPYLAPELLTGDGENLYQSDIWSLGIILFQLSTRQFPWLVAGTTTSSSSSPLPYRKYLRHPARFLSNYDLPPTLHHLILSLLHPNPNSRPTIFQLTTLLNSSSLT